MRRLVYFLLLISIVGCGGTQSVEVLPNAATQQPVNIEDPEAGEQLAVENRINVPGKLLLVNDGNIVMIKGDMTTHITSSGKKYQPSWSSDGTQVAYIQREESFSDVWVMDVDGSNKIRITNNEPEGIPARSTDHIVSITWAFYPEWSPDGNLLTYVSQARPPQYYGSSEVPVEYPLSLYLYGTRRIGDGKPAGPSFEQLSKPGIDLSHPTWNIDNLLLVYAQASRDVDQTQTLGYFHFDTGASGGLSGQTAEQFDDTMDPDIAPNGRWMSYVKRTDSSSDIWVTPAPDATGSVAGTAQQLTQGRRIRMPTWSPDSQKLAFFEARNNTIMLNIADVETSGAGQLSLSNIQEIWQGNFDVDSGLSWIK